MATATILSGQAESSRDELLWMLQQSRPPRLRTIEQFATEEVTLPNGPYAGMKLRQFMQPATFLWFQQLAKWEFRRHAYVGPVQSGKTLSALVVPLMWVLFERQETAILGAPKLEIAHDKWREDFLPVIKKSRYANLLPTKGAGSRGGKPQSDVTFENGVTLKFMSGQGSDDSRSAYTSRWVFVTEVDKMDVSTSTSREADPISQLEDRLMAYDRIGGGYIFLESSASILSGRIWTEYTNGTESRIVVKCLHCLVAVCLEREDFKGWESATSEQEAMASGHFVCPECGDVWTEEDRLTSNQNPILLHRGQALDEQGNVTGDRPPTSTFGFRVSAINNCFITDATISRTLWKASQHEHQSEAYENAEKTILQKFFAKPYDPPRLDDTILDWRAVSKRVDKIPKGQLPEDTLFFTIGVDLRKREGHWFALVSRETSQFHVPDYGKFDIASDDLGVERALMQGLRQFRELCEQGWMWIGKENRQPDAVWIDAGYKGKYVFEFCRESGQRYLPTLGRGAGQQSPYTRPRRKSQLVRHIGDDYHIEWSAKYGVFIVQLNTNEWKSHVHARLTTPDNEPGSLRFFDDQGDRKTHESIARHLTAEHAEQQFKPGVGVHTKWITDSRLNHWLDSAYLAHAAQNFCGFQLTEPETFQEPEVAAVGASHVETGDDSYSRRSRW